MSTHEVADAHTDACYSTYALALSQISSRLSQHASFLNSTLAARRANARRHHRHSSQRTIVGAGFEIVGQKAADCMQLVAESPATRSAWVQALEAHGVRAWAVATQPAERWE